MLKLSSANAQNLDKAIILSSGNGLTFYQTIPKEEGFGKHC